MARCCFRFALMALSAWYASWPVPTAAQYYNTFGYNKVQYSNFNWRVMKTEHIDLYYYPEERALAEVAAASAERSYRALEAQFSLSIRRRIPLILYSAHHYFEETNTIPDLIPESVGAFTEFLKGRVVIPHLGSYYEFDRVLRHELVHVFTLEKIRSVLTAHRRALTVGPPLWFTEGLAEHWSEGWSAEADMIIRDAVLSGYLVDIPNMNSIYGTFLMYKEGQAFLKFLAERYGDDVIELMFENWWRGRSFEEVVQVSVGKSLEALSDEWTYTLRKQYYPLLERTDLPAKAARPLTTRGLNIKPVCVPAEGDSAKDGGMVFLSTRAGYEDICWAPLNETEKHVQLLVRGGRSPKFESFHFLQSKMAVNQTRQLAFVSKSEARDVLYVWNLRTRRIDRRFQFDEIVGLSSPSWSPDRRRLVFSGLDRGGQSDLYVVEYESGRLVKLTNDLYHDSDPDWSPDGHRIAFSSDRVDGGDRDGWRNLFTIDPNTGEIEYLTHGQHHDTAPRWSPDGQWLAFTSDRDVGIDVYLVDTARQCYRLTRLATGAFDPSWTPDGRSLIVMGFQGFAFQLYRLSIPDSLNPVAVPPIDKRLALWQPPRVERQYANASAPYRRQFSLDFAQGALLAQPQTTDVGVGGGVLFSLSDMLGDHYYNFLVSNSTETTRDFLKNFNVYASRVNLARRLQYGYGVFHLAGQFFNDRDGLFTERRAGVQFLVSYPFSKFTRIEGAVGILHSEKDLSLFGGHRRAELIANYASYVKDTALWGVVGPVDGESYQIGVTHVTDIIRGASHTTTMLADYRRYFRLANRVTYATRALTISSFGREPQIIRLGGSWDFRGYPFRSLRGDRMFLVNQELRFPLLDILRLGFPFGTMSFTGIQGAVFLDTGNVWEGSEFGQVSISVGAGCRLGLGGPLVLRFDFAKPVVNHFKSREKGTKFHFFFGPNF